MRRYNNKNNVEDDFLGIVILVLLIYFLKYWQYILIIIGIVILYKIIRFIIDLDLTSSLKRSKIYYQGDSGKRWLKELEFDQEHGVDNQLQINLAKKGLYGENKTLYTLSHMDIPMYIMHDVELGYEDYKVQIDFVLITKRCIYLLEVKDLNGNITVENDGTITRVIGSTKKGIRNPLTQSNDHKKIIQRILKKEKIRSSVKSLVVFSNDDSYIHFKRNANKYRDYIIRNDQLEAKLKEFESKKHVVRQEEKIKGICNTILKYKVASVKTKEEIVNLLKQYRKEISLMEKIPAYMVYNDETILDLANRKPTNIESLKDVVGLGEYKIQKYGKKIIEIINDSDNMY